MSVIATGTIPETTGTDRTAYTILGAVPLCHGEGLWRGGIFGLRFEENGASFPVEGTPAAWGPDRSIKWLRLCGTVDLKGGSPNRFRLMADGPTSEQGLTVRRLPGIVEVSGGPLAVRISPDVHRVLHVSSPDGPLWTRGPGLSGCFDETLWKPFQRPSPHDAMLFLTLAWRTTGDVRYRQTVEQEPC